MLDQNSFWVPHWDESQYQGNGLAGNQRSVANAEARDVRCHGRGWGWGILPQVIGVLSNGVPPCRHWKEKPKGTSWSLKLSLMVESLTTQSSTLGARWFCEFSWWNGHLLCEATVMWKTIINQHFPTSTELGAKNPMIRIDYWIARESFHVDPCCTFYARILPGLNCLQPCSAFGHKSLMETGHLAASREQCLGVSDSDTLRWSTPLCMVVDECLSLSLALSLSLSINPSIHPSIYLSIYGYGSIPIDTIFRGMNIHLPAILMFTRGTRFWHTAINIYIYTHHIISYHIYISIYISYGNLARV